MTKAVWRAVIIPLVWRVGTGWPVFSFRSTNPGMVISLQSWWIRYGSRLSLETFDRFYVSWPHFWIRYWLSDSFKLITAFTFLNHPPTTHPSFFVTSQINIPILIPPFSLSVLTSCLFGNDPSIVTAWIHNHRFIWVAHSHKWHYTGRDTITIDRCHVFSATTWLQLSPYDDVHWNLILISTCLSICLNR